MSTLADEVVKNLAKRHGERRHILTAEEVDKVLDHLGIPSSATKATSPSPPVGGTHRVPRVPRQP